jgi:uncharacterized secreted protein with C-terminal beta-propeller domain
MKAFTSERELRQYFARIAEKQKRVANETLNAMTETVNVSSVVTIEGADEASITNTQHAGVDEGAIVKLHGDPSSYCVADGSSPWQSAKVL